MASVARAPDTARALLGPEGPSLRVRCLALVVRLLGDGLPLQISRDDLGAALGVSRRQVQRLVTEAEGDGWLDVERDGSGRWTRLRVPPEVLPAGCGDVENSEPGSHGCLPPEKPGSHGCLPGRVVGVMDVSQVGVMDVSQVGSWETSMTPTLTNLQEFGWHASCSDDDDDDDHHPDGEDDARGDVENSAERLAPSQLQRALEIAVADRVSLYRSGKLKQPIHSLPRYRESLLRDWEQNPETPRLILEQAGELRRDVKPANARPLAKLARAPTDHARARRVYGSLGEQQLDLTRDELARMPDVVLDRLERDAHDGAPTVSPQLRALLLSLSDRSRA